jgi:hypothetical protein
MLRQGSRSLVHLSSGVREWIVIAGHDARVTTQLGNSMILRCGRIWSLSSEALTNQARYVGSLPDH